MIIVGCGYTGLRLARREQAAGRAVTGIVSSEAGERRLAACGIDSLRADLDKAGNVPALPVGRAIVYLVPPPREGTADPRLERLLGTLAAPPPRVVYASTTGVYGNRDGARVDETDAPSPESSRAVRRLAAETALREWCEAHDVPWIVLRVPGIYGPDRLQIAAAQGSRPMLAPQFAGPGNRIHVEDLVTALRAAAQTPHVNQVYNVGDGDPMSNTRFVGLVAEALELPAPHTTDPETLRTRVGAAAWSFLRESREVDVSKMRRLLGVVPRFADPREGIAASLREMAGESG